MKLKIAGIGTFIIITGLIISVAWQSFYQKISHQPFSCRATLTQYKNDSSLNLAIKIMFKNGYGTFALNGHLKTSGEVDLTFNRKIYFTYQHDGEFYPLMNQKILKYPGDNVPEVKAQEYLSDFYMKTGEEIYVNILRQQNGNNLFFTETIPFFSCKEVDMSSH